MGFLAALAPVFAGGASALAGGASTLGTIASIGGGLLGAIGSIAQGNASANAAEYQAKVAENNAQIARQNQEWSERSAITNEAAQGMKTRAQLGAIKAAQAASGVDVNTGSAVDVRSSAAELGQLDAINIRANAAREAYGYGTQAQGFTDQAALDRSTAGNARTAGYIGAGTSLLGGAASAASNYAKWSMAGGGQTTAAFVNDTRPSMSSFKIGII